MTVKETAQKNPQSLTGRAYAFAERAHAGQMRKSGDPYFTHLLATAETLERWRMDEATIAAGLLHDVVEDTAVTAEELKKAFGDEIAFLVDGVTKLSRIKYRGAEGKVENLRKMIMAISQDLRVLFIKLADRLHNMKTLSPLPPPKQKRIALETSEVYAAIAYRLGMWELSGELQDLAFPYLYPTEYKWLEAHVSDEYETRRKYLEAIKPQLEIILKNAKLKPVGSDFRAKRYYSLYQKLKRNDMDVSRIYDLIALRLIFSTVPECYAALGVIHQHWIPLPGRIKDYIAMPKANNYQSLHTTVIGPDGKYLEIQLRTREMHEESEFGLAAHWLYKERGSGTYGAAWRKKIATNLTWLKQLRGWRERKPEEKDKNPKEFLESMKIDFFKDWIFVITPKGDVLDLPESATPIDFAYHIHTEVGDGAIGARVNGKIVPLNHKLASGDMVEILIQKGKKPSEDWLKFVKTSMARDHIRVGLRDKRTIAGGRRAPSRIEIRLAAQNRIGLIKDVSHVISRSHIQIISFHSTDQKGSHFSVYRIECATTDKNKIEKIILKLKKIKEVREIGYRII
ncbi:MAG: bifunctional (p)ppGpp synthetase/guanosine-3',5'-bis(diphosphate) 3'-pyrophosphohydrolase [Candidatus Liptonbacteria bacterium]|nr:bifunctional (p)ppGpp synthetase/guanosine-3',5'-bis(diphosphate) 3'-pyrophosphohydrolase [Candidatus Liptonbacteria bacterium]